MTGATTPTNRGDALLLSHCAAFGLERPEPFARLEREIGPQLAKMLVFALCGRQGRPGSSSP
ncbi:MAG TPA: hypothetical protein VGU02_01215 [Gaiellaceae bacterium]|nr:hypothetical protein [Gaiellaceae bacterium]